MTDLPPGLVAWAAMPGSARVLHAIRDRASRGFRTDAGTLRVDLSPDERDEVARVLGTPWNVSGRSVRLQDLSRSLALHGLTVLGFVEALDGKPVVNRREVRISREATADAERSAALSLLLDAGITPEHADAWLADPSLPRPGTGGMVTLAEQTVHVWQTLQRTSRDRMRLAELAATLLDNAHALDFREELGRAVSRLIALAYGLPRPLRPGRDWRQAWLAAGIHCDGVSSRVLVLNLPLTGTAPAASLATSTPGEPVWLSLRSLTGEWTAPTGTQFYVCENVTIVEAAADILGPTCQPLICTDGIPTYAALDLIAGLAAADCPIHARADFDEAGFVVFDQIHSVAPAVVPWRFEATTYAHHLGVAHDPAGDLRVLFGRHRVSVHEEALLDLLLTDLSLPE